MTRIPIDTGSSRRAAGAAFALFVALSLPVVLPAAGAKDIVFKTGWKDRDIVIDGRNDEWQGALGYLGDPVVALGFLNDASGLYVCIATNVPALSKGLLQRGMTVWIDPKGGKKKTLGIRLAPTAPPGGPGDRPQDGPPEGGKDRPLEPPAPGQGIGPGDRPGSPVRLMVRLPGREDWMPVAAAAGGIEAAIEESNGLAVFEMALPLTEGPGVPVALGARPGAAIAMSFETPRPERPTGRVGGPGDERNDPLGGRDAFGGPPGDVTGRPGGRRPGDMDPLREVEGLKLRVEMKLASR
jgi:hypothetical protein